MGTATRPRTRSGPTTALLGGAVLASTLWACSDPAAEGRIVVDAPWDTVLVLGSMSANDTVLIDPAQILVWGNRLAILEDLPQRVRVFSPEGEDRWSFGRPGQGPGEMLQAFHMGEDRFGHLRIADGRNRKLLEVDPDGRFVGERYYRDLPLASDNPTFVGDRVVWSQYLPDRPTFITDLDSLHVVDSVHIPWPLPEGHKYRPDMSTWTATNGGQWVAALWVGPYFAVGDEAGVVVHPMVEDFFWAYAPSRELQQDATADSAYFGAQAVAMAGDEIFILGGGRPRRRAHDEEGSRIIDVYGTDGVYRRSYVLPFDSRAFDTADGEVFYVLTTVDEAYPHLFGLRVRAGGSRE